MSKINSAALHQSLFEDLKSAGWYGYCTAFLRNRFHSNIGPNKADVLQYCMSSLSESFMKKFHNDETDSTRDAAALSLFLEANRKCRDFAALGHADADVRLAIGHFEARFYDFWFPTQAEQQASFAQSKKVLFTDEKGNEHYVRNPRPYYFDEELLNLSSIQYYFSLGGGANIGAKSTDFLSKYSCSSMATTDLSMHRLFMHAISGDNLWSSVEKTRHQKFGAKVVRGNRLSFVPKSNVISRTICTEPLLNMFFQKGIGGVIESRLNQVFKIDLAEQPDFNRSLARIGSVDGSLCTIDLKSASDSISLGMLERFMPKSQLKWLKLCRSPLTILPDGSEEVLHMVSSMGNGFTFPLQTALFACLVAGVYDSLGLKLKSHSKRNVGNFGVFGDDIICRSECYTLVVKCLEYLGFTVNTSKSYNTGLFRESCGRDYLYGHDTRGVYVQTLKQPGDLYSAINRLNRWSAIHGIPLPRTVSNLRRGCRFFGVPFDEADDAGIKVPLSYLDRPKRDRNGTHIYLASVNAPRMVRLPLLGVDDQVTERDYRRVKRFLPDFHYDPDSLLLSLVAGSLRSGKVGLRALNPGSKTVLRKRVTLGWDNMTSAAELNFSALFSSWEAAVEINLEG